MCLFVRTELVNFFELIINMCVFAGNVGGEPAERAKPGPKPGKGRKPAADQVKKPKEYEFSVTISAGSKDIDQSVMPLLDAFLKEKCAAGMFALERGEIAMHLHAQGIIRLTCTGALNANSMIKKAIGWDKDRPTGAIINCKGLHGQKLHTFHGMVGYCMKDSLEPHFQSVSFNITDEDICMGQDVYLRYGGGPLKTRTPLDPGSVFFKACTWKRYNNLQNPRTSLNRTLTSMIQTGKYFPTGDWVIPVKGQGWDRERAEILWQLLQHPREANLSQVDKIFSRQELFKDGHNVERRNRYFEDEERQWEVDRIADSLMYPAPQNVSNLQPELEVTEGMLAEQNVS